MDQEHLFKKELIKNVSSFFSKKRAEAYKRYQNELLSILSQQQDVYNLIDETLDGSKEDISD